MVYILLRRNKRGKRKRNGKKIGYYEPEKRIEKEYCEVLFDSKKTLVLLTPKDVIAQFENN